MNSLKFIFPQSFSKSKCYSLIGNSINVGCAQQFLSECLTPSINSPQPTNIKFVDLFAGIGGFHLTLLGWGKCVLAVDNNKNCQETYQLNFPTTPFLLGDINDSEIQARIISKDLLLENVPQLVNYPLWGEIKSQLSHWGYALYYRLINPLELGIPQNRPRLFIWGQKQPLNAHE